MTRAVTIRWAVALIAAYAMFVAACASNGNANTGPVGTCPVPAALQSTAQPVAPLDQ